MTFRIPKIVLTVATACVVLLLWTSYASAQEATPVEIGRQRTKHVVTMDGETIDRFGRERKANLLALRLKADNPNAHVVIKTVTKAVLRGGEPTTAAAPVRPAPVAANLTTGLDATPPSTSWTRPQLGVTRTDPAYGTPVTRMTSADGTRFDRNTYSRRNPENADGTAFLSYHGDATYNVNRVSDGSLIRVTDIHPDGEPQWHPTDPNRLRHVAGANSYVGELVLFETRISSGATTPIADLTERLTARFPGALYMIDRAEGAPSADGNRWAWIVYNDDENPIGIVHYDLATDRILGTIDVDPSVEYRLDWVSSSPTGNHVMAGFWEETLVFDADMSNRRVVVEGGEHSDIALGANGHDVYVWIDFVDSGWAIATDLETGAETRLFDLYDDANTSIHFSGKAYDTPGWVVASTYSCKENGSPWSCHKVFAVNVHTAEIVNLAHTYNCGADYWTETLAATNRELSRVWFNSDAGSCGINAEVYRLDVPNLTK
jgi:hypothetical protein